MASEPVIVDRAVLGSLVVGLRTLLDRIQAMRSSGAMTEPVFSEMAEWCARGAQAIELYAAHPAAVPPEPAPLPAVPEPSPPEPADERKRARPHAR